MCCRVIWHYDVITFSILQQHHQPLLHHHQYHHHHQQCNTSPRPYLPNTRTLLCDTTEESAAATSTTSASTATASTTMMASANDPVISRIKRDVERKQEFLRATHLPNYLASPNTSSNTMTSPTTTIQQQPGSSAPDQQCQPQQQPGPSSSHPVYFGDRFPVHQPRGDEVAESEAAISAAAVGGPGSRSGVASQFHLYGLPLGKNYYFLYLYILIYIFFSWNWNTILDCFCCYFTKKKYRHGGTVTEYFINCRLML